MSLSERIKKAKRVYIIGNGGSYANAIHMQNDLISCGVKAHTLDPATLTATANDCGYEQIFSNWIHTFGEPGDLLIALSGSGKSPNILNAVDMATLRGMDVACIFGAHTDMQSAEEEQVILGHDLMRELKCA